MKSLQQSITEALGNITPKDFMNIWKGKNITIDSVHLKNLTYVTTEILKVHRGSLPTESEFTNVCKWIAVNYKGTDMKIVERFLDRFVEVFFQKHINASITVNTYNRDFKKNIPVTSLYILDKTDARYTIMQRSIFFGNLLLKRSTNPTEIDYIKNVLSDIGKDYNIDYTNWPDYSEGLDILSKTFYK